MILLTCRMIIVQAETGSCEGCSVIGLILGRSGQIGPNRLHFAGNISSKCVTRAFGIAVTQQTVCKDPVLVFKRLGYLKDAVGIGVRGIGRLLILLEEPVQSEALVLGDNRRANIVDGVLE